MSQNWRLRVLILLAVCSIAGAVLAISTIERAEENRVSQQLIAGQQMLSTLIEAHDALQSYAGDGDVNDAVAFGVEQRDYAAATRSAFLADSEQTRRASLARQNVVADEYFRQGRVVIQGLRSGRIRGLSVGQVHMFGALLHRFEGENRSYFALIERDRRASLNLAQWVSVGLVLGLSLLFGGIGQILLTRSQRRDSTRRRGDDKHREDQREFTEVLQVTESEADAYGLIKRHIERMLPASHVTVMSRNNSRDRLEPRTALKPGTELAERLLDAEPRSCLAIRLVREHVRTPDTEGLLTCGICERLGPTVCVPSLVGGEVIGSVLVERDEPLGDAERGRVADTVGQASPALGNLRNLAVSEGRALTDVLTGLPNARAVHDTLKRMVAQASRMVVPLSAIMVDLDHFKQINDKLGHEKGDEALAASGDVLGSSARESDFVGRYGGDEFLVLLPNTDKEGALEVAEKLRQAISLINAPGTDSMLTTSCGVATYPVDAKDAEGLLRLADRALYAAKAAGRNRVAEAVLNETEDEHASVNGAAAKRS